MRSTDLTRWAIALVVLAYGLGGPRRLERLGLSDWESDLWFAAGAAVLLAVAHLWQRTARVVRVSPAWVASGLIFIACDVACAARAETAGPAWAAVAERALALGAFYLVQRSTLSTRRTLAEVGTGLVLLQTALLLIGAIVCSVRGVVTWPFMPPGTHQHTGGLLRFYGIGVNPFYCGVNMLAAVGLCTLAPCKWRRCVIVLASIVCIATLSFVTLLVPLLVVTPLITRRALRYSASACLAVAALCILYVHPLRVTVHEHSLMLGELQPNYGQEGRGPQFMPVWTVKLGPIALTAHATAYFYLAQRALGCFLEHPVLGVGPNNFSESCPVWVMGNYGVWNDHVPAHNQYLGLLAEEGALGSLAGLVFAYCVRRSLRARQLQSRLLWIYLLAGLGSPVLHVLPFVAWLAGMTTRTSQTRSRREGR